MSFDLRAKLSRENSGGLTVSPQIMLGQLKLNQQIHIYSEEVSPGGYYKHVYMATPLFYSKSQKRILLPRKEWGYRPKTLACRHNLILRIIWGWPHLATPIHFYESILSM